MNISPHAPKILGIIKQYQDIVITMHVNPDGDAIGSSFGLACFLSEVLGKNVCIYNESPMPKWLSFLPLPCPYHMQIQDIPFDNPLIITLDAGEVQRFGEAFIPYLQGKESICVDHHLGNTHFAAAYTWADPAMAATGQMIAQIVYSHSDKTTQNVARALYVALSCDTGNFTFGNTSSECIQCLARLVDTPLALAPIREAMDNTWSAGKLHFWGKLYGMVDFALDGQLASIGVPCDIYEEFAVSKEDLEGFVEQMRKVKSVRFAMLMREEHKDGKPFIKVSMRSSGDDDVREILAHFGGGGHKNAAGAGIFGSLEEVYAKIYPHIEKSIAQNKK